MITEPNTSLKISQSTAQLVTDFLALMSKRDVVPFGELGCIKKAMNHMVRMGGLPQEPEKRLLDMHMVSERLAIGESTLRRLLANGAINLPKVKIGGAVRFRLSDVESLIDNVEIEIIRHPTIVNLLIIPILKIFHFQNNRIPQ